VSGELRLRPSRVRYGALLAIALGFVALGLVLVFAAGAPWIGWANVIFFGAAVPLFLRQLLDRRPRLVIDGEGVLDRTLGVGVIPWSEITGADFAGSDFIRLSLRDPARCTARLGRVGRGLVAANRAAGFGELNLNLQGLAVRREDVLQSILARCARSGGDAS
jgi:hypothetical protein